MTPYKMLSINLGSTNAGLYNYYIYDLLDYLVEDNEPISLEDHVLITEFLNKKNGNEHINPIDGKTYQKENEYTGLAEGMNLIAIQLESFTSLLIDLEVNGIEITPNINQIVKKSRYYDNFYSTSGIGNTSDAEFSFNTGLYGNGRNLTIFDYVGDNYPTIARGFNKRAMILSHLMAMKESSTIDILNIKERLVITDIMIVDILKANMFMVLLMTMICWTKLLI